MLINTNLLTPGFPHFYCFRCKLGVTFTRRCFRDDENLPSSSERLTEEMVESHYQIDFFVYATKSTFEGFAVSYRITMEVI